MEILTGIAMGIGLILLMILIRPITTTIHELGHALPALWSTDGPVTVYVGSYGNIENSTSFQLGRLQYIFKMNLFDWNIGMCRHDAKTSLRDELLIILGGPVASLIFGLLLWFFYSSFDGELIRFVVAVFIVSTILDFVVNIW
ncbi:MAG: hypothetical protein AAFO94_14445, partial [Bacteroidota bacterium]